MVRRITELGHFVLPVELRRSLGIVNKDSLEMFIDDDLLILKKYEPTCFFCKEQTTNVKIFNRRIICSKCIEMIRSLFK